MYLFRQPESSKRDIRKREVSDDIDPTVAGKFWQFWSLKVFRTNWKTVPAANTPCLLKEFEFVCKKKQAMTSLLRKFLSQRNAPINVNPVGGGGGGSAGKGRGFDVWDYPHVGLLIVRSDPRVGTFDFDRKRPGINSSINLYQSVSRGFLKSRCWRKVWSFHLF